MQILILVLMNVTVNQILRPVKLAILIQPNKKSSYLKAIQICSSIWGGKHFPILPIYKKFSKQYREEYHLFIKKPIEFYRNILRNFDPDFLVIDGNLDQTTVDAIKRGRETISIGDLEESILNGECKYGIAIDEVLQIIKEKEFTYQRTDSLRVCCPQIRNRDFFTMTLCGTIKSQYFEKIRSVEFPEKYISYPKINRGNLDRCIDKNILNYLSLGTYQTNVFGSPFWTSGFAVYILDPEALNDLINLWNYRALGWNIIPIPIGMIDDPYYRRQVELQQIEFQKYSRLDNRINVLANHEVELENFHQFIDQLAAIQSNPEKPIEYIRHWWLPRFWEKGQFLSYDKAAAVTVRSDSKQTILGIEDTKVQVPILHPIFKKRYIRHIKPRFINEISIEFDETEGKYAQALPDLPDKELDFIIRGSGFSQWTFSEGAMNFCAQEKDEYLSFTIPKASEVFKKWFESRKLEIKRSASGKLANQLLKNIGGVYGTNFFANQGIPPVLSLFENGKTVLRRTLDAELNKQHRHFRDADIGILKAKLLDKSIIEFGAQVQCTFCNQHSFYKLNELTEKVKCPVCQNIFFTPSHKPDEIKWAYKGMGSFSRNNKAEGLLCVLMALRFFRITMHPSLITPQLNFELLEGGQVINEIDLGVFFKEYAKSNDPIDQFLCECKMEIDFGTKDVEKMKKIGLLFPGAILTFATLKPELSDSEKEIIGKVANYFRKGICDRPRNPVLILTSNELLPKELFRPFANIEQ